MRTDPAHHGLDEHGFRQFGLIAPFQCCQLFLAHVQLAGELVLAQARSSPRLGQLSPCFNQARGFALVVRQTPLVHQWVDRPRSKLNLGRSNSAVSN